MNTTGSNTLSSASNGFCPVCGIWGQGVHYANCPTLKEHAPVLWPTEEAIRHIVREEIEKWAQRQEQIRERQHD